MRVENVHLIRGRIAFQVRKTPLEEEILKVYSDCPKCVKRTDQGVVVRPPMKVLFASGQAHLTPAGKTLLQKFLPVVRGHVKNGFKISIEGNTDSTPVRTSTFQSNWELSSGRACAVVRYFLGRGIAPKHFRAVGHTANLPVASNKTPGGRAKNRRVEITFNTKSRVKPKKNDIFGPDKEVPPG